MPGVTHVVLLEGINDIGFPGAKLGQLTLADSADMQTAEDLIGFHAVDTKLQGTPEFGRGPKCQLAISLYRSRPVRRWTIEVGDDCSEDADKRN